jgi:hypothetical protein
MRPWAFPPKLAQPCRLGFFFRAKQDVMASKHPPGPPMTLGNMRHLGVQRLVASCLNDACRVVCAKWGVDRRMVLVM